MKDRVALFLASLVAAFHLAVANRYDLFRDELYFIVCGRHPAFGYVDQPPLVPFAAAATYALGHQTWLVRLPAVFAAAALVYVVVAFVRLLGGRDGAAWIAGVAAGFAPMLLGVTATLNTTTFEPLAWTVVAYGVARAALLDDRRALLWSGIVAGVALECKYTLPLWLVALAVGLIPYAQRRIFRYRELWIGLASAFVIAAPSVIWQASHGFPFVELVHNAGDKDSIVAPVAFVLNQLLVFNPLFAPIWFCGLVAPFIVRDLRDVRFLSLAFAIAAAVIIAEHGKDYYLAGAYPSMFAVGAIALARFVRATFARVAYVALAAGVALIGAPLALPMLAPEALLSYQHAMHLAPDTQENGDRGDGLPPTFADMLGWHDFVREVGTAYDALPPEQRARTAIVVDDYGQAAALDIYGGEYHLPDALSGHNQYFVWGLRGQQPVDVLRVQRHAERLRPYCASMLVLGTTESRYARAFENGNAIALCRGVRPNLATLWPTLKRTI